MKCALRNKDKKRIWEKKFFEAIRPVDKEKDRPTDRHTDIENIPRKVERTFSKHSLASPRFC